MVSFIIASYVQHHRNHIQSCVIFALLLVLLYRKQVGFSLVFGCSLQVDWIKDSSFIGSFVKLEAWILGIILLNFEFKSVITIKLFGYSTLNRDWAYSCLIWILPSIAIIVITRRNIFVCLNWISKSSLDYIHFNHKLMILREYGSPIHCLKTLNTDRFKLAHLIGYQSIHRPLVTSFKVFQSLIKLNSTKLGHKCTMELLEEASF